MKTLKIAILTILIIFSIMTITFNAYSQTNITTLFENCEEGKVLNKSTIYIKDKKNNNEVKEVKKHLNSNNLELLEEFIKSFDKDRNIAYEVNEINKGDFFSKTYTFYHGEIGPYKVKKYKKKDSIKTVYKLDTKLPNTKCSIIKYHDGSFIVNIIETHS